MPRRHFICRQNKPRQFGLRHFRGGSGRSWYRNPNQGYRSIDWNLDLNEILNQTKSEKDVLKREIKDLKQVVKVREKYDDFDSQLIQRIDDLEDRLKLLNKLIKQLDPSKISSFVPKSVKSNRRLKSIVVLLILLGKL